MGARTEVRLASVDLFDSHFPNGGVAVRVCALDDLGERCALLRSPRDEERADACQRNADLHCIRGEELVSAPHEARLELARRYLQVFGPATPEAFARSPKADRSSLKISWRT